MNNNKYNIKREMRDEIFAQHSRLREGKRKRFKTDEEDSRILSKKLLLFLSVCHLFFFFGLLNFMVVGKGRGFWCLCHLFFLSFFLFLKTPLPAPRTSAQVLSVYI